ncbi:MAG: FtsW/RodA/SpoVE family cell cycle protein, partial [Bacilli bacterium]
MPSSKKKPDFIIILSTLFLVSIGVIMVYSASAVLSFQNYGDWYYLTKRQLLFAGLGVIAMLVMMNIHYHTWHKWAKVGIIVCFVLLIIVLIPGVGILRNGARSWLGIGAFSIQPSEFMKLAMIAFLARYLSGNQEKITLFFKGLVPPLLLAGTAFGLIMLQPDLGSGTVLIGTAMVMIFISGARMSHLNGLILLGVMGFVALILAAPYRMERIYSFIDPWKDPLDDGYQIIQSLFAIGPGGLFGL